MDDNPSGTVSDVYTISVTVTDDDTGCGSNIATVRVGNVAPTVEAGLDCLANEGETVVVNAVFADIGTLDTHAATIDWGDGIVEPGVVDESAGEVSGGHVYADDGVYAVTITVTDDDGGVGTDTLTVTVLNVAPILAPLASQPSVEEGQFITLDPATFSDRGFDNFLNVGGETEESFTATIDWGDGTTEPVVDIVLIESDGAPGTPTTGTIDASHAYADNGTYTVTVTVFDDDGGSDSQSFEVTIANVSPTLTIVNDQLVDEGVLLSITNIGTFTDPGFDNPLNSGQTEESFTYSIDWGDETPPDTGSPLWVSGGEGILTNGWFDSSHTYADDGMYTVVVTVADDDGGLDIATFDVTVNNVAPTVEAGTDQTVNEGKLLKLDPATFNDLGTLDTHTATIDWGDGIVESGTVTESPFGPPGSTSGADGTVSGSHVYADNGTYTITVTVTDDEGAPTSDILTVTVLNVAPEVTTSIDPERLIEVQYSDPIDEIIFRATDVPADIMNAAVFYSTDGGATFTPGLPDDGTIDGELAFDGDSNQIGTGTWTLSGIADLAPDTYVIRVTVSDENGGSTPVEISLTVLPEDAFATYVGAQFVSTPSVTQSTAVVELRAVIHDTTIVDPVADPDWGNIRTATVTFVNRETGIVIAADVPVELINGDPRTGTATFEWTVDLGSSNGQSFFIGIIVKGFYDRNDSTDDTIVTVSKPLQNSISGSGFLINENSAGLFAGDPGLRTNFGFNLRFNKARTNLQGHVNVILRRDGHVYQIKSTALSSLVADPKTGQATVVAKANLIDVTDPDNPISMGGNLSLIITLTDGESLGIADSVGITLWNRNKLWFSSNWTGAKTIEQYLAGGNLVVRN